MSSPVTDIPVRGGNITAVPLLPDSERKPLTKKEMSADHPTWCPGCGDFSVLALYFKLIEKRKLWHEKVTTIAGAALAARTTRSNPNHVPQMMEAAMGHQGFGFIECLSECVEFYPGAFDSSNPRKGGAFNLVPETHDVTDEIAAYKLADEPFPGKFGVFYKVDRPTKNKLEADINAKAKERVKGLKDWQILQQNFDRMK